MTTTATTATLTLPAESWHHIACAAVAIEDATREQAVDILQAVIKRLPEDGPEVCALRRLLEALMGLLDFEDADAAD
jgi:uncharacterized membrane protein YccC